jgi:hypothetical protein
VSGGTRKKVEDWPVVWRVVAPAAGSYDTDMVMLETEDEEDAFRQFRRLRCTGWPVRLEQVRCGPLPDRYESRLAALRKGNSQNRDTEMRTIPGAWTD